MNKKKRVKFSNEEEQKIIEFVKRNEVLFNVKHKRFRESETKTRLWEQLAKDIEKDAKDIKKKWSTMRDYFMRTQGNKKKTTGPAIYTTRDESLLFLLQTSKLKKETLTSVSSTPTDTSTDEDSLFTFSDLETKSLSNSDFLSLTDVYDKSLSKPDASDVKTPKSSKLNPKKRSFANDTADILREFLESKHPETVKFLSPPPQLKDNLQQFFESIGSTMRTFSPLAIAKIKQQISQIVSAEEISSAETNVQPISGVKSVYIYDNTYQIQAD